MGYKMTVQETFDLLLAEAYKRQLPKQYENDVIVHDLSQLTDSYGEGCECGRFLWVLRTCGSFMWTEENHRSQRHQTGSLLTAWKQSGDEEKLWYYFDGAELKEVTPEQGYKIPWDIWNATI